MKVREWRRNSDGTGTVFTEDGEYVEATFEVDVVTPDTILLGDHK